MTCEIVNRRHPASLCTSNHTMPYTTKPNSRRSFGARGLASGSGKFEHNVILEGSTMQPRPRPPTTPSTQGYQHFEPLVMEEIPDDPSNLSQLLRGGCPMQDPDPYVSFYNDIQGWEEDQSSELLDQLLAKNASFQYLAYPEDTLLIEEPPRDPTRPKKKLLKSTCNRLATPKFKNDLPSNRRYSQENIKNFETEDDDQKLSQVRKQFVKFSLPECAPLSNSKLPSISPMSINSIKKSASYISHALTIVNSPAADKRQIMRRRAGANEISSKVSWCDLNRSNSMELTMVVGKKYKNGSSQQEQQKMASNRPKTTQNAVYSRITIYDQQDQSLDRMVLPVISQSSDIPFAKSKHKQPTHNSLENPSVLDKQSSSTGNCDMPKWFVSGRAKISQRPSTCQ